MTREDTLEEQAREAINLLGELFYIDELLTNASKAKVRRKVYKFLIEEENLS